VALGAGRDFRCHALGGDDCSSAYVGWNDGRIRHRTRNPYDAHARDSGGREGGADDPTWAHAGTNGPGAFKYRFLIASNAQ
jgi:hypothetical protein